MTSTRILLVIAILQGLTLVTLWKGDAVATPARAALPDPGADRKDMIAELKSIDDKLGAIDKVLESGKLQVEVVAADNKK